MSINRGRGRPKSHKDDVRDKLVRIRMNVDELAHIKFAMMTNGYSNMSEYIRDAALMQIRDKRDGVI